MTCDLEKYQLLSDKTYYTCLGRVSKVVGLTIESIGPEAKLNDLCKIYRDREQKEYVMAEVVGFKDNRLLLMPFDSIEGLGVGCIVANTGHPLSVLVGDEVLSIFWMELDDRQMWMRFIPIRNIRLKPHHQIR